MAALVGIEVNNTPDTDPVALIGFFEKTGHDKVKRNTASARGEAGIVQIILTIVGTWAAERYLLDPFADKLQEWVEAATSLKGKQFKISIHFQEGRLVSVETFRISNPMIVQNIWMIIKAASDLLTAHTQEIPLDRVLIVPGKLDKPLVIGYQGTHPTHLLELSTSKILSIKTKADQPVEDIEQLMSDLENLQVFRGHSKG